jgi:DNA helicase-2/ATP-dependent DNA helicase PcrA
MATDTPEEIEEERRLLYVAMTRAKEDLHLLVPQRFYTHNQPRHGDRHVYAARSRFIPSTLLHLFKRSQRSAVLNAAYSSRFDSRCNGRRGSFAGDVALGSGSEAPARCPFPG